MGVGVGEDGEVRWIHVPSPMTKLIWEAKQLHTFCSTNQLIVMQMSGLRLRQEGSKSE